MPKAKSQKESGGPPRGQLKLATVLHALSDDIRLNIVRQIDAGGEKACGTFNIDLPKSSLSHHFKVLREAGVLSVRRVGKELINSLRSEELEIQFPGLIKVVVTVPHR